MKPIQQWFKVRYQCKMSLHYAQIVHLEYRICLLAMKIRISNGFKLFKLARVKPQITQYTGCGIIIIINVYQLGTGRCSQNVEPIQGAYLYPR